MRCVGPLYFIFAFNKQFMVTVNHGRDCLYKYPNNGHIMSHLTPWSPVPAGVGPFLSCTLASFAHWVIRSTCCSCVGVCSRFVKTLNFLEPEFRRLQANNAFRVKVPCLLDVSNSFNSNAVCGLATCTFKWDSVSLSSLVFSFGTECTSLFLNECQSIWIKCLVNAHLKTLRGFILGQGSHLKVYIWMWWKKRSW